MAEGKERKHGTWLHNSLDLALPLTCEFLSRNMGRGELEVQKYYLICTFPTTTPEISSKRITVSLLPAYQQASLSKLLLVCLDVLKHTTHFLMRL